jgi:hypothetical protein
VIASLQMTTNEVARRLGCDSKTVKAMQAAGVLPAIWTPRGPRYAADDVIRTWRRGRPWQGRWPAATKGANHVD